jgi:hypothetical protein
MRRISVSGVRIALVDDRSFTIAGACLLTHHDRMRPDRPYGIVLDFFMMPDDHASFALLIAEIIRGASEAGCYKLQIFTGHGEHDLHLALRDYGFRESECAFTLQLSGNPCHT